MFFVLKPLIATYFDSLIGSHEEGANEYIR